MAPARAMVAGARLWPCACVVLLSQDVDLLTKLQGSRQGSTATRSSTARLGDCSPACQASRSRAPGGPSSPSHPGILNSLPERSSVSILATRVGSLLAALCPLAVEGIARQFAEPMSAVPPFEPQPRGPGDHPAGRPTRVRAFACVHGAGHGRGVAQARHTRRRGGTCGRGVVLRPPRAGPAPGQWRARASCACAATWGPGCARPTARGGPRCTTP